MRYFSSVKLKIKILGLVMTIGFIFFISVLFYFQLLSHRKFNKEAILVHRKETTLLPTRGEIYDAKGRLLTQSQSCYSLYILPQYLKDDKRRNKVAEILTKYFKEYSKDEIEKKLKKKKAFFYFKKYFDYEIGKKILKEIKKNFLTDAVFLVEMKKRVYPFQEVVNILGKVREDSGLLGLEKSLQNYLAGKKGYWLLQKDALGNFYPHPSYPKIPPQNGADVFLTIDFDVQQMAYELLKKWVLEEGAIKGSLIIIDAESGGILALVDYPCVNPVHSWLTPASVCEEFEPGSIFKIVILSAILSERDKNTFLNRKYDLSLGYLPIGKRKIYDAEKKKLGFVDFNKIFTYSSNIGVAQLALMLGEEKFFAMAEKLGFDQKTGIELPNEAKGYIPYLRKRSTRPTIDFCNNAFGQGLRVSLLQIAYAYLAIANDGIYLKPYLVREVLFPDGTKKVFRPETIRVVMEREVASSIKEILNEVCEEGTGVLAKFGEVSVCGKTGTAQKLEPKTKQYSNKRSILSFVGFFPKEKPKFLIAAILDEPKRSRFASTACCPLFREIAAKLYFLWQQNYLAKY